MDFDLEDDFVPRPCECEAGDSEWIWHSEDCPLFIDSEEYYKEEYD